MVEWTGKKDGWMDIKNGWIDKKIDGWLDG